MAMNPDQRFNPDLPDRGPSPTWAGAVRRELDADADALDAATRSRLNRARQAAVSASGGGRWLGAKLWLPAGAAAALALAVVLQPGPERRASVEPVVAAGAVEDLELLQQGESPELYEDQEFYAWLDASEPSPG
jgi:hypothetical protein